MPQRLKLAGSIDHRSSRIGVLNGLPALREAGGRLGISLVLMLPQQGTPAEMERVFAAIEQQRPDAVLVSGESDLYAHRQLIADLARKHRLPAIYPYRDYVEAGGLMAYAVDLAEQRPASKKRLWSARYCVNPRPETRSDSASTRARGRSPRARSSRQSR